MAHFEELPNRGEHTELPGRPREIKPAGEMTRDEAMGFVKGLFGEGRLERYVLDPREGAREVYDRSETEFTFRDYRFDADTLRAMSRFDPRTWGLLSEQGKENALRELASCICRSLQIGDEPKLEFTDDLPGRHGSYYNGTNTVKLNRRYLEEPMTVMGTLAHELRHAYQYRRANLCQTKMDALYRYNFDHYVHAIRQPDGSYKHFNEYQDQLVEAEARAFSRLFQTRR